MKKKDLIVIIILVLLIGGGYFVFQLLQGEKEVVEVYYKNQVVETIDIKIDKVYTLKGSYGNFSLEVKDGKYHAINVECPNHDCEKVGWVNQGSSKQIVCVPNEIYVIQTGVEDNIQK
ncbi:MAG: NusG domain II-containing protein [Coprobacillus sp.]|nr:NusG domain II-containing protein [Coprobacillus sp.]MCI9093150.1 NusG domain II-containing protein [Coprobacillus sp.]